MRETIFPTLCIVSKPQLLNDVFTSKHQKLLFEDGLCLFSSGWKQKLFSIPDEINQYLSIHPAVFLGNTNCVAKRG